ncbi:MAG: hypothetical protein KJ066_15140 [Acidobacteria bacterium]|nr:hypothetical protein [Acidobacteriota bacterium]
MATPAGSKRPTSCTGLTALAVLVFLYGLARAATLAITHDEALTYLLHVQASWPDVLAHAGPIASNNHLLNTTAVKLLVSILPPTELVVRLPALGGLAIYLGAAIHLLRTTTSGLRQPLGLLLLAVNPFVLDLLVLSRGYALALGLSLVSLAALVDAGTTPSTGRRVGRRVLAVVAAAGAVLSNLGFAYAFVALAVVSAVTASCHAGGSLRRRPGAVVAAVTPFVLGAVPLAAVYTPRAIARVRGSLDSWGGERGLWADTVPSLIDGMIHGAPWIAPFADTAIVVSTTLAACLAVVAALAFVSRTRRRAAPEPVDSLIGVSITFVAAWGLVATAAAVAFDMRYPTERAASALVPVATLLAIALWEAAVRVRPATARLVAVVVTAAVVHFVLCANLTHTYLWRYDAGGRDAMRVVARAASASDGAFVAGASWLLEPAANFYRVTWGLSSLAPIDRGVPAPDADVYYLGTWDRAIVRERALTVCAEYPASGTLLAVPSVRSCPGHR